MCGLKSKLNNSSMYSLPKRETYDFFLSVLMAFHFEDFRASDPMQSFHTFSGDLLENFSPFETKMTA